MQIFVLMLQKSLLFILKKSDIIQWYPLCKEGRWKIFRK